MKYSALVTHLSTSATAVSGIGTFEIGVVDNVNNNSSKSYMYVQILPIESTGKRRSTMNNREYTINGYIDDNRDSTAEATQFQEIEDKFDLFLTAICAHADVNLKEETYKLTRIPKYANSELLTINFQFTLMVTQC